MKGAIFLTSLCTYQYKSNFSEIYCSKWKWNRQRQKICSNNNCSYRTWLQKWVIVPYVFRCHQCGDVTWFSFRSVLLCCAVSSQLWNSSAFTHSHSDSSAATSSATREYWTVPERPSRNEKQSSINVSKRCAVKPDVHFGMKPWTFCIISINLMNSLVFSYFGETFDLLHELIFIVSAREYALRCPLLTDWVRKFSVERWRRRSLWEKDWLEGVFPRQSRIFVSK